MFLFCRVSWLCLSTVWTVFSFNCIHSTVFVPPTACVNSLPTFELCDELYDDQHCLNLLLECDGCVNSLPTFELCDELYDDQHCLYLLLERDGGRLPTVC